MSEKERELLAASAALLPFLEASTDRSSGYWARVESERELSKAERLRREADEIEAKDAAIVRFRKAVAAFHPLGDNTGPWLDVQEAVRAAAREESEGE